jgi:uncharacterized protein (TIGR00290 family)
MRRQNPRALIAWSGGKDSAWALHEVRASGTYDVVAALTTIADPAGRVSMHDVREDLLLAQLGAAGLRSIVVRIPNPCPNDIYEQRMRAALAQAKSDGVTHVIFGDLFLADIRAYREARLTEAGLAAVFPLWQRPTGTLARDMIAAGVEAHLATVDLAKLPQSFAGRRFDSTLLSELPPQADPCGENGEFHSFVSGGPMLAHTIRVAVGETSVRGGFAYADLRPAQ